MKFFAVFVTIVFWASLFWRPPLALRLVLFVCALLLGILFTLFGGFSYWWDSSMQPSKKSAVVFVCGLLTLASQLGVFLRGLASEFDMSNR